MVSNPREAKGMYMLEASLDTGEQVISLLENAVYTNMKKGI